MVRVVLLGAVLAMTGCAHERPWLASDWRMDRCVGSSGQICDCWRRPGQSRQSSDGRTEYVCSLPGYELPLAACMHELEGMPSQPKSLDEARLVVVGCMEQRGWQHSEFVESR